MRREARGRQGNTTWFARNIMTFQGHRLQSVGIIMLDVFQFWLNKKCILLLLKGILSTSCVIFSYPKLLSISVLTFIKWRLTPNYVAKDTIFWQKRPTTIAIRIIVWMTIFKSIHMAFYVNTSWAWSLFRNNKQHVVLGQKRNCQRVEESGLWWIQR